MDWLQITANGAQVLGVIWMLLFGGKTIIDIGKHLGNKHLIMPVIKLHPFVILSFLVAATLVILLGVFIRPILIPISLSPSQTTYDPSSGSTLSSTKWVAILKESAPNCSNPDGVEWYVHNLQGETDYSCGTSELMMQQVSPHYYAEMDLEKVKGNSYNQTNFRLLVHIRFQNLNDPSTLAAIIVQTPSPRNEVGGYIFGLSPSGLWQLQHVTAQGITTVDQKVNTIDAHQSILLTVVVQNGMLYASINNQTVTSSPDNLDTSSREVGLMVERTGVAPSSSVRFTNLELDKQIA